VFRAEANGKALQFDTDELIGGNEVFKDRQTGSHWQQSSAQAISGPLKGTKLAFYPFLLTTWQEWLEQHPDTMVLKPLPGYADRIADMNKILKQGPPGAGKAPSGAFGHDGRLHPYDVIAGLEVAGDAKAFSISALKKVRVVNDHVGGQPVLIVHQPASDTTTAFVAQINGKTLSFEALDSSVRKLSDAQTHSIWNDYGLCLSGALKGSQLQTLVLEPEFWFAWSEFHPKSELYSLGGSPH
jgi:hypothetical protein